MDLLNMVDSANYYGYGTWQQKENVSKIISARSKITGVWDVNTTINIMIQGLARFYIVSKFLDRKPTNLHGTM